MIPRRPGASKLTPQSDLLRQVTYIAVCTFAIPSSLRYVDTALGISLALEDTMEEEHPDEMTLCLCPTCASQFYNSPTHSIRRLDPYSKEKDDCTYCQVRKGYDYLIRNKKSPHR